MRKWRISLLRLLPSRILAGDCVCTVRYGRGTGYCVHAKKYRRTGLQVAGKDIWIRATYSQKPWSREWQREDHED